MTWARTLVTGSGRLDFRLEIAGCQHEWTTNPRITHASGADERRVFPGLQYQGLELNERAILKDCWVDVSGITARIKPTTSSEETIEAFTRTPEPVAYLAEGGGIPGLEADTTTIHLDSAATLPEGVYHLGSEAIRVTDTANHIARALWGTTAQRHYVAYGASSAVSVPLYRYPPTLEGRRATLYVYGEGDDGAGNGTAIWRGIVARPPRLSSDGIGWEIALDPITKALEQNVAAAESLQYRVRGIYHSERFPFHVKYYMGVNPQTDTLPSGALPEVYLCGFWETTEAFTASVNAQLASIIAARATSLGHAAEIVKAVYLETSALYQAPTLACTTSTTFASDYDYASAGFFVKSFLEGYCTMQVGSMQFTEQNGASEPLALPLATNFSWQIQSVGHIQTAIERFGNGSGEFAAPAGIFGQHSRDKPIFTYPLPPARAALGIPPDPSGPQTVNSLYPGTRLYLTSVDGLSAGGVLLVKNGDRVIPIQIDSVDAAARSITAHILSSDIVVWFDQNTEIVPARIFALNTDLHGFVSQLEAQAPNANDGDTPYLPTGDLALDAFAVPFALSDVPDYWRYRNYVWLKPTSIKEIVREELKAIGWMLRLTATGSVGCTRLPLATGASTSVTMDEGRGDILLPAKSQVGAWPRWEAQADGLVNTIQVSLGYRIGDDDFDPKFDFTVRNITSIAEHKSNGSKGDQKIAPKSSSAFTATLPGINPDPSVSAMLNQVLNPTSVSQWVAGYLRVLSQDYATVTVAVPFRFFGLLIGDYVNVTCSLLPNGLGGRGVSNAKAVVVGRKWSLDPAANAMGTLTLYFPREVASGYAPSGHVTSHTNVSANTWDLFCSVSDTLNVLMSEDADGNVAKHFAANDRVQVVKRNDGVSPTTVLGTVVSVSGNTVRVSFSSTWVPGADAWVLQFQIDTTNATPHMRLFTFVADAIRELPTGGYARRYL